MQLEEKLKIFLTCLTLEPETLPLERWEDKVSLAAKMQILLAKS